MVALFESVQDRVGNFEMRQIRTLGSSCRNRFGLGAIADIAVSTAATNLSAALP